jgi:hypothetical protein
MVFMQGPGRLDKSFLRMGDDDDVSSWIGIHGVGWAKAHLRCAHHSDVFMQNKLVGTLALCPPYGASATRIWRIGLRLKGRSEDVPPDQDGNKGSQVPFMITGAQKARLLEMGYSEGAISEMTPAEAHELLGISG